MNSINQSSTNAKFHQNPILQCSSKPSLMMLIGAADQFESAACKSVWQAFAAAEHIPKLDQVIASQLLATFRHGNFNHQIYSQQNLQDS